MSTLTKEQVTVEKLIPDINAAHKAFITSGQETLEYARQIGNDLLKIKECIKHGEWEELIEQRFDFTPQSASGYMKLAAGWSVLKGKDATETATIGGCLKLIGQSKPKKGGNRKSPSISPTSADSKGAQRKNSSPQPAAAKEPEKAESNGKVSGGTSFNVEELTGDSKDAFGEQAPDDLRQVFELCEEFDAQRAKLTGIKSWMTQRLAHPGAAVLVDAAQRIKTDLDHLDAELKFAKPYCVCVYCKNESPKVANCNCCKGRGWMTEQLYKAAPKGLKREKAQA